MTASVPSGKADTMHGVKAKARVLGTLCTVHTAVMRGRESPLAHEQQQL